MAHSTTEFLKREEPTNELSGGEQKAYPSPNSGKRIQKDLYEILWFTDNLRH